ncbi:MAG: NAD(+) diphosphatase [Gammaproteobacteria bacterium]|nr:NAD(+) diphosphatase [Gammaproteobacteria bacterium]
MTAIPNDHDPHECYADLQDGAAYLLFYKSVVVLRSRVAGLSAEPDLKDSSQYDLFWPAELLARQTLSLAAIIPVDAGFGDDSALYAVALDQLPAFMSGAVTVPVRQLLMERGFEAFSLVGRASQWINWYRSHQFCGRCGSRNEVRSGGGLLHCVACEADYYPRINPCVIVLVTDGHKVLLARSSRPGANFFSCLAGFIEPGETAEEAVAREVYEEAGIQIKNIRYVKSQPWPFPSQLMLGFYADYAGGELNPCPQELAEAAWFDITQLPLVPDAGISVAGQLIEGYLDLLNPKE